MTMFYRPKLYLLIDVLVQLISIYVVLEWFPLTTQVPFSKYLPSFLFFIFTWTVCSYLLGRYRSLKQQRYFKSSLKLFYTTLIVFGVCWCYYSFFSATPQLSEYVLLSVSAILFTVSYFFLFVYYAYHYATEYETLDFSAVERENAYVQLQPDLDEETYNNRCTLIQSYSGEKAFVFFNNYLNLRSANTYFFISRTIEELKVTPRYKYDTIVRLEKLNSSRGINKMLYVLNEKLPDKGVFICCFESKSTRKKRIFNRYPKYIRNIVYFFHFIIHRILPKIFISRRLYYDITGGKNRILSKTEVIGRLYCSGYEVIADKKIGELTYITARRKKQAESVKQHRYGPLIRLRRYGKNGKILTVYKFRTMHSYAEYMQEYIYSHNNLQEGGKFKNDIRVTTLGRFMRKYWIDEFPMFLNLLKGDMKLIGVRPLSAHYFSLYSKELQEKRIKFKPGLLPPFYADMPKNLDDIQASEMRYLIECEEKGVFKTDVRYFFSIIKNILFKKARSA
jgi:Sugar transferases involved in lipopolysaccharide synthesis